MWVANAVELARERATPRDVFGVSVVVAAFGGTVTCLVALAISPLFGDKWWVFALPSLITPFVLLRAYQEGIWQALGHVRAVNVLRLGRASLPFLFILPPLLADAPIRTTIVIWELAASWSWRSPPGSGCGSSSAAHGFRATAPSTGA